jgi:hypothetical protein
MSLGNISKEIRRSPSAHATALVGYIPCPSFQCFEDETNQTVAGWRLFHHCMGQIFDPLIQAGESGLDMTCSDGLVRHVYPILSVFVADHPERCRVACCKQNRCPRCLVYPNELGDNTVAQARMPTRTLRILDRHASKKFTTAFESDGLRPVYAPFWAKLPHSNIFSSFAPDILHELHNGVFGAHLKDWCLKLAGSKEIDNRFKCMVDFPSLSYFRKGISRISQWTGEISN